MAKATHNPGKTETRVVEISPETFTLELTRDEANIIVAAFGKFLSSDKTSPIYKALSDAGADGEDYTVMMKGQGLDTFDTRPRTLRVVQRHPGDIW